MKPATNRDFYKEIDSRDLEKTGLKDGACMSVSLVTFCTRERTSTR